MGCIKYTICEKMFEIGTFSVPRPVPARAVVSPCATNGNGCDMQVTTSTGMVAVAHNVFVRCSTCTVFFGATT